MARPRFHALMTLPAAWLAHRRWGPWAAAGTVASGVFIDLDHLVDYAWTRWRNQRSHYIAPLHGWELAGAMAGLAIWVVEKRLNHPPLPDRLVRRPAGLRDHLVHGPLGSLVAGIASGWLLHLVHDHFTNRPRHAGVYSLGYRLRHQFRREITGWGEHTNFHGWSHLPWYRWF